MINRLLIRIKVLQVLYNYYAFEGRMTEDRALQILEDALEASYRLYITLCGLPLALSDAAENRLAIEEEKFRKQEEKIALLKHLLDNPLVALIRSDEEFITLYEDLAYTSIALDEYHGDIITDLLTSENPQEVDWASYDDVKEWWRGLYKSAYQQSEAFEDRLGDLSIYLNDDIGIVFTFATKVFNGMDDKLQYIKNLRPKYSNDDNKTFGPDLLTKVIHNSAELKEDLTKYLKEWDADRVSRIDSIILRMALAEALYYPQIPTTIIINEYLNLAHVYSSNNSSKYTNGILHNLFTDLKEEGRILGD